MADNHKITDFFAKAEANSSNKSSSVGSNKNRSPDRLSGPPSGAEYPAGAKYPGFKSICHSSVKESSTHSRRGTQSNISNSSTSFKRSYNAMKMDQNSKQSLKKSITKSSSKKHKYSDEDEVLILTTFSKMKRTMISKSTQTTPKQENSFKDTKSNVYLPD